LQNIIGEFVHNLKKTYYLLSLLLYALILSSCNTENGSRTISTPPVEQSEIIIEPYLDKMSYQIGETISHNLIITNPYQNSVEFRGLAFCEYQLAFVAPNAIHLIEPDGQDLLKPYEQREFYENDCPPIQIKGEEAYRGRITISEWLHLRKPGEYIFWLELTDILGRKYHSNKITFELVPIQESIPSKLIDLTLQSDRVSFTVEQLLNVEVELESIFTNKSSQPVTFLEPQGGSFNNLINPFYQLTVFDSNGRSLRKIPGDANIAQPVYNESTQFSLEPGNSHSIKFLLRHFPEMRQPGQYQIQLTYITRETDVAYGFVLDEPMNWPEDVFVGVLESNKITITITE
jgi:hypothetical protein